MEPAAKPSFWHRLKGSQLVSGSATYLLSNLITAAIPFALLPVLTRYLHPAEYGEVAMFQTLVGALSAFVGLNVAGAAGRKYFDAKDKGEQQAFLAACLQILLATALLAFLGVFALHRVLEGWLGLGATWILLAVPMSMMSMLMQLRLVQWQVRKQAGNYAALQILYSILNMGLSLLLVTVVLMGADGRMAAQLAAIAIVAAVGLLSLHRDGLLALFVWRPAFLKEALQFGVPLIPHVAGIFLVGSVDRFVVNSELGTATAGIYMVAAQLGAGIGLAFDAFNNAYVPWLYERLKREGEHEKIQVVRRTYAWLLIMLLMGAIAFVLGPPVVRLIAGARYAAAGDLIGWIALGQCFAGMYVMFANYLFYARRTGALSAATLTCGAINVGLLLVLTPLYGAVGAALAFSIAMALRFLFTWAAAQYFHPMPWFQALRSR